MAVGLANSDWFFKRKLDNLEYIKEYSVQELNGLLFDLPQLPKFHTKPRKNQRATFLLQQKYPNLLIFSDPGVGKSWNIVNDIKYKKETGQLKLPALVLVPDTSNIWNFLEQVHEHTPSLRGEALVGTLNDRVKQLMTPADVFIINYMGLQALMTDLVIDKDAKEKDKNSKKRKRELNPAIIVQFAKRFGYLCCDEITFIKNSRSNTYKILEEMSKHIPFRYGLSGTPFGRQPLDLWAEFYVIDHGESLSKNFFFFRALFFDEKQTPWASEWKLKKDKKESLYLATKHRSIRYSAAECKDLPPINRIPIYIELDDEAKTYYKKIVGDLIATKKDKWLSELKNHFIKLRQVCSGFLNYREDNELQTINFTPVKIPILKQWIESIPDDSKMIIFHEFTPSGQYIADLLKSLKVPFGWIHGAIKDSKEIQEAFKNDPKYRFLILNTHSGAFGLNLQVATYEFFYETTSDPIIRKQAEDRATGARQDKMSWIIDTVIQNSIEMKIQTMLKEGKDLFKEIIEGRTLLEDAI